MKGTNELLLYLNYDSVLHHENLLWHPKISLCLYTRRDIQPTENLLPKLSSFGSKIRHSTLLA